MSSLPPLLFNASGPVPTPPTTLQNNLVTQVAANAPGYTANLPGSLIEDMSSTAVGALATVDQARVDAINSVTPYGANPYVLTQLGSQVGIPQGQPTNGNANVVFSGTAGYVIPPGFIVSDGTNQYAVQSGGIISSTGSSLPVYVVATNSSTFAIPANSITQVITSVPSGSTVTCNNPNAGNPAQGAESVQSYRSRILQAGRVAISGAATYIKTLLLAVPGVSSRLVSVIQNGTSWEVICSGGDSYQMAYAIYQGVSSLGLLVGSSTGARNVTVPIYDAPNNYSVVYVNPPQQNVTMQVTWNTTLTGFTAGNVVNQMIVTAATSYINGIVVGQPINLLVLQEQIQLAIASVLAPVNLTTLQFAVTINGVSASPTAGTSIIPSDPESFFYVAPGGVTSIQ